MGTTLSLQNIWQARNELHRESAWHAPKLFPTLVGMTGTMRDASRTGENPSGPPGFQHFLFGFLKFPTST